MKIRNSFRQWLPLIGLTVSAFIFNTTEFVPIGLLTDISNDFEITEATAGLLISVYAWFVALMSLPLMLIFSRIEYRKLLLGIIGVFIVSHILSSVSDSFMMLMLSRIGVASSHAIFWSIVTPMAVSIAPEGKRNVALSMIATGTSVAMIAGMPLGRAIGLYMGWRVTFICIAFVALMILALLAIVLPKVTDVERASVNKLPSIIKSPLLLTFYVFTFLFVTSHYTAYSYIEPYLTQIANMSANMVTLSLTIFGIAGIGGSVLFSIFFGIRPKRFVVLLTIGLTTLLLLMQISSMSYLTVFIHCIFWGMIVTAFNLVMQSEIIRTTPHAATMAISIFSSVFNVGIGCGAVIGGAVASGLSVSNIGYIGGIIAALASVFCIKQVVPYIGGKM